MKETNQTKTKKHTNKKKGISLIVLVITIIVMIILAAAVILSLSSNGIIDRANEAVTRTDLAQVQTLASIIWSEIYLENLEGANLDYETEVPKRLGEQKIDTTKYNIVADASGVTVTIKGEQTPSNVPEKWKAYVSDVVGGVPIPKGFIASPYEDEDEVSEGLVIYEILPDDTSTDIATIDGSHQNSLEKRNQYVWIPVDKDTFETTFVRRDFTTENTTNTKVVNEEGKYYALGTLSKSWEVDPTTDETDDKNKQFIEISTTPPSTTIKEVQEMYASVEEYGGFYIARYEAGLGTDPTVSGVHRREKGTNASDLPTGHDNVHFKMGQIPYAYIPWTWNDKINEETNGAVSVARSLYPNNSSNTTGVISTLTYGVQWDTTVQWFKTNGKYGEGKTPVGDVTNSTAYGNYTDRKIDKGNLNPNAKYWDYTTSSSNRYEAVEYDEATKTVSQDEKSTKISWALSTGALKDAKINNIYDMAGNMWEWTMEGSSGDMRVRRGGGFGENSSSSPVSFRGGNTPNLAFDDISFRSALYIKK